MVFKKVFFASICKQSKAFITILYKPYGLFIYEYIQNVMAVLMRKKNMNVRKELESMIKHYMIQ
jgi:hypothetical protein